MLRRLASIVRRRAIEDGLDEEIRFHIDQQIEKNIRAGMTPDEARRQAFVRFGGVEHVKEQTRDRIPAGARSRISGATCRYGARVLRRAPAFAIVVDRDARRSASAPPPPSSASSTACC